MSFQEPDSNRENFRKYLETSGVVDQLTRVLVGLYEEPEKPSNAIDFIRRYLGTPSDIEVESLTSQYEAIKERNSQLDREIKELNEELQSLKPSE